MRIIVIGGTGLVGAKLVDALRRRGHDVVVASRRCGVDTLTGEASEIFGLTPSLTSTTCKPQLEARIQPARRPKDSSLNPMIAAYPRNEEDGMQVRRGAVPEARTFHPLMRGVPQKALLSLEPDSYTTTPRAGNLVSETYYTTFINEIHNPWKQFLSTQLALNFSPTSPTSHAIRWQQSKQPFGFSTATSPLRLAERKREQ